MATTSTPPSTPGVQDVAPRRSDRSPWNWLLLIPIVVPLIVPLYNAVDPKLGSWPLFYGLQRAFGALGVVTPVRVYRRPRRPAAERAAAARAAAEAKSQDREG